MTERNTFKKIDIEEMAKALEAAPAPERDLTKAEALDALAPQLKAARERGHTLASLVEQLASQGLKTHVRAVSESIARLDASKPARGRKAKRRSGETHSGGDDAQLRKRLEDAGQQRLPA